MDNMKIALFTTFGGWDTSYSPVNVVKHHLEALKLHGYTPILFTLDCFKAPDDPCFEGVELRNVLPTLTFEPYQGVAASRNVPQQFEKDLAKVIPAYEEHFKDIDIFLCHDIIFQDSFLPYGAALHKFNMRKNQRFFHWMHSGPSLRPNDLSWPISCLYTLPPQSKLVYMNNYDIVRAAEMYGVYPRDVRIVHNPIDIRTENGIDPLVKRIVTEFKLNEADIIGVYPLSTTRMNAGGKQLNKAIKVMAGMKKLGKSIRYIVPNAHANGQKEKIAIAEVLQFAKDQGLDDGDLIFTSLLGKEYEGGIPHDVVLQLFGLSDIFLFPSVSENCPLVLLEAALKKNLLVLNEDFTPMKDFVGPDAFYFKFDSVTTTTNHPRGEDVYYQDIAKIIVAELEVNKIYRSARTIRQRFNLDYIFKNQIEPLFFEGGVPSEGEPMDQAPVVVEADISTSVIPTALPNVSTSVLTTSYTENEEKLDFPDFEKVFQRYQNKGILKDPIQIRMYEAISKGWCIGKAVIDAGCGMGIGTNILGREAIGAWGVDVNPKNIDVAKQMFENMKIKFETVDLLKDHERPFGTFDIVVCIEVIEHVKDFDLLLNNLKKFYDPKRRTIFFISSPNRNSEKLGKEKPNNEFHVREWTAGEFYEVLTKHFKSVVMYSGEKLDTFSQEETIDGDSNETPILAKCELPI